MAEGTVLKVAVRKEAEAAQVVLRMQEQLEQGLAEVEGLREMEARSRMRFLLLASLMMAWKAR